MADSAEVRGFGPFHGADVNTSIPPGRPRHGGSCSCGPIARSTSDTRSKSTELSHPRRRTTIRRGQRGGRDDRAVIAAVTGLRIDNCVVEIDAGECPGCDGSSGAFVEALDRAVLSSRIGIAGGFWYSNAPVTVSDRDAVLCGHSRRSREDDSRLSPRLRSRISDRAPKLLHRIVSRLFPRRVGGQPHLPARAGSRGAAPPPGSELGQLPSTY